MRDLGDYVIRAVMPEGVEHSPEMRGDEPVGVGVIRAVMPEGVEHASETRSSPPPPPRDPGRDAGRR